MKLKIGEISYANMYPVFETLRGRFDCSEYEFVPGVPSDLNIRLREGDIHVSPSSSVEYLKNKELYRLIDGHSISSYGAVQSILLFSREPLERLEGKRIAVTSESDTSALLLRVILERFRGIRPVYARRRVDLPDSDDSSAASLLIGDAALRAAVTEIDWKRYDLGALWTKETGLPFVWALWIHRKDLGAELESLVRALADQIRQTGYLMKFDLAALARSAPQAEWLGERRLVDYWENLSYELAARHMEALDLFAKLIGELPVER